MGTETPFPNRPPPLPYPTPPTTLISLTPSPRVHSILAVLLGMDGPQEISKKDGTTILLSTLRLVDDTLPTGLELLIWGRQALQTANFRVMDLLHVTKAIVADDRFRGIVLKFRGDARVQRVPDGLYPGIVRRLLKWRSENFQELLDLAREGRLRCRDWVRGEVGTNVRNDGTIAAIAESTRVSEVDGVQIVSVRIRVTRKQPWDELDGIRGVCRRSCTRCGKRASEAGCECGCREWRWSFGWLIVGLRDGSGEFSAIAEGDVVKRLLFGVDVETIVADDEVARECRQVLEALVRDGGHFRVVVEGRGRQRLRLLHLFV